MAVYGPNRCAAIGGARSALGRSRLRSQIVDAPAGEDEERQTTRRAALYRRARGARSPAERPRPAMQRFPAGRLTALLRQLRDRAGKGLEFAEVDTFGSPRHRDDRSELTALPSAA